MKTRITILLILTFALNLKLKAQSPVSPIGPVATQFYYDTSDSSHWTHDVRGYFKLNTGGGGGGTWGSITGILSNQIDLQAALDAKQNLLMFGNGIITTSGVTGLGGTLIRTTVIDNTGFDFTIADNTGTGLYLIPSFKGFFADDGAGHAADLLIQGTESGKATAGFFMDALNGSTVKSIDGTDNAVGHGIWVQDTQDRIGLNAESQPNYTGTGTGPLQYTTRHYVDSVATGGGGGVTSVSGTANRITSTGGATPVIDISASYTGQSSITTLGTITTGVWNGTAIANANLANSLTTVNGTSINLGASGTVTAAAGTLTGTTLNSSVVTSSLTSVGTLSSGAIPWSLITSTPTTIAGYGITDGLTLTGTQSVSNKTFRPANIFQTGLGTAGTDSLVVKTSGALKAISPTYYQIAGTYVTGIGVTTANGISGSSSGGTTPNLTLTLGNIVPTTISTTIKPATVYQTAAGTAGTDSVMVKHSGGIVDAISPTYYLASTTAASTYVPQTTTVNGKALSSNITLGLASSDFANQGTTTTVLHGNGSGNPSFGQIINADITNATIDLTTKVTGILPNANTTATATPAASVIGLWDANKNFSANSLLNGYTTIVTAAGTTTLVVGSTAFQFFTGSTTQTVLLPVTSTLALGQQFIINNQSTGNVTIQSSGANTVIVLNGGNSAMVTCILTSGTTAASWLVTAMGNTTITGTGSDVKSSGATFTGTTTIGTTNISNLALGSTGNNNNLTLSGSSSPFGGTAAALYQLNGSSSMRYRVGAVGNTSTTITAGDSYAGNLFGGSNITTNTSGTSAILTNVGIGSAGTYTLGTGSTTTWATSLYIDGPPTIAGSGTLTNPVLAMYVKSGNSLFGGNVSLGLGNELKVTEGSGGFAGGATLVSGTKAITISGVTTSSRAFVQLVTPSGVTLTTAYQAVCTANTLTIQANVAAGTINVADGSTLNYFIIN